MVQNIVNSLGGGSGIDSLNLVDQLVEIQAAPETERLDKKETLLSAQLSDFGVLRSALGELETALSTISDEATFDAKALDIPETNLFVPTAIESNAQAGTYQMTVDQIARSQSLSSTTFSAASDPVGTGTLTIRFGEWTDGALDEDATSVFTVDADKTGGTITIDATNNSLTGLRDAINDADIGVQASIVNDGSGFRLMLSAPSGAGNEIEIVVAEDDAVPTNNDANGLSRFAFNEGGSQLSQLQSGRDAELTVNGLAITRESNTIDDVIDGLKFTLQNSSTTETVSLSISADRSIAKQNIRDFVTAYNTFLDTVDNLTGFDEELEDYGSLRNDPLANNMVKKLRGLIGASVPGVSSGFNALTNVGIRTNRDGTIQLVEDEFTNAFDDNFELVKSLFVPKLDSDSALIDANSFNSSTKPGSYSVAISSMATQGELIATTLAGPPVSFDSTGKDWTFTISVDSTESGTITIPDASTYTPEELAVELQTLINSDTELSAANKDVSVSWDTDHFVFTSNELGSRSTVAVTEVGADAAELGLAVATGTSGTDVSGTVDGVAGFGFGNVFLPKLDTDATGLSMLISEGATTATVSFSRGFSTEMSRVIDDFLKSSGLIRQRENSLRERQNDVEEDRERLEVRTEAYRARLQAQFIAMDQIVQSLKNTGSFFDGIADRLPFTAGN